MYYRARYLDPSIGRFTQRDPIGLASGINLYAYANGNPLNLTDPSGLYTASSSAAFSRSGGGGKGAPDMSNSSSYPSDPFSSSVPSEQNLIQLARADIYVTKGQDDSYNYQAVDNKGSQELAGQFNKLLIRLWP